MWKEGRTGGGRKRYAREQTEIGHLPPKEEIIPFSEDDT